MDKIWIENPSKSEVIGRCGRDEKNRQKLNAKKKKNQKVDIHTEDLFAYTYIYNVL